MLRQERNGQDSQSSQDQDEPESQSDKKNKKNLSIKTIVKKFIKPKNGDSFREAIEEVIDQNDQSEDSDIGALVHEQNLIRNILELRDSRVIDVMIPRADIVGIDIDCSGENLMSILTEHQYSRFPVYRDNLDNIIGTVHIKDILAKIAAGEDFKLSELIRDVPIISPAMPLIDLLLLIQESHKHMALVVDEFGGIDGLVTIGDVLETIVGEIDDEYDKDETFEMVDRPDGSVLASARTEIDDLEEKFGSFLDEEEREDIDTVGGLVFSVAGRVPARGEVLKHPAGFEFEILESDGRKISKIVIRRTEAYTTNNSE